MNIKNTVSLNIKEAVELLTKIADSLEHQGQFHFDIKGQEVTVEAGEIMKAQVGISLDEFSIVFNWGTTAQEEEIKTSLKKEDQIEKQPTKVKTKAKIPATAKMKEMKGPTKRALPERKILNTTTLPLEGGYWTSAFTSNGDSQWSQINIDSELENKKWASDDQITTLSDLTPTPAKPKTSRSSSKKEDDLFSDLDKMDNRGTVKTSSRSKTSDQNTSSETRKSVAPAASLQNMPSPTSVNKDDIDSAADNWQEPNRTENTTQDDWVKPSEYLKQKQQSKVREKATSSNIPKPGSATKTSKTDVPQPSTTESVESKLNSIPSPGSVKQPSSSDDKEVLEWREPSREDNVSDDDWVKPSEFLGKKKKDEDDPRNRPPPTAPDSKD